MKGALVRGLSTSLNRNQGGNAKTPKRANEECRQKKAGK